MRRADGEPLTYQLTAGSHGGPAWQNVQFPIELDAAGSASIRPAIYAEILSQGESVKGGFYSSSFTGADLELTFGEVDCSQVGPVTGGFAVSANVAVIDVTCTDAAPYTVTLGPGGGDATDPRARQMRNGASYLTYGLYRDPGRTAAWGWMAGQEQSGTGTGRTQFLTVYGRINGGQIGQLGTYTDSVVVTVTY
jgi:spore coat protein U-like protein